MVMRFFGYLFIIQRAILTVRIDSISYGQFLSASESMNNSTLEHFFHLTNFGFVHFDKGNQQNYENQHKITKSKVDSWIWFSLIKEFVRFFHTEGEKLMNELHTAKYDWNCYSNAHTPHIQPICGWEWCVCGRTEVLMRFDLSKI